MVSTFSLVTKLNIEAKLRYCHGVQSFLFSRANYVLNPSILNAGLNFLSERFINKSNDASAASNRALKMAAQMAEQHGAELLIIHVIRDMQIPYEIKEIPELESKQFDSFNSAREEVMRKIAETVLRDAEPKRRKPVPARFRRPSEPVTPRPVSLLLPSAEKQT